MKYPQCSVQGEKLAWDGSVMVLPSLSTFRAAVPPGLWLNVRSASIRTQWKLVPGQMCMDTMCPAGGCALGGGRPAVPLRKTKPSRSAATLTASHVSAVHFAPEPLPGCAKLQAHAKPDSAGSAQHCEARQAASQIPVCDDVVGVIIAVVRRAFRHPAATIVHVEIERWRRIRPDNRNFEAVSGLHRVGSWSGCSTAHVAHASA